MHFGTTCVFGNERQRLTECVCAYIYKARECVCDKVERREEGGLRRRRQTARRIWAWESQCDLGSEGDA